MHASWPELVGNEMIQSGNMSSSTGWTQPLGSAIAGGKMNWTAVAAAAGCTNDGVPAAALISDARYLTSMDISGLLAGTVSIALGDEVGTAWGGNGTNLSEVMLAADPMGDGFRIFNSSGGAATLSLDNVSVKSFQGMGVASNWTLGGSATFGAGGDVQFQEDNTDTAALTGSAQTVFDAAVSANTGCSVTIVGGNGTATTQLIGSIDVSLRGGAPVTFTFSDAPGEAVTHTVTSGTGSGYLMDSNNGSPAVGSVALIRISLA